MAPAAAMAAPPAAAAATALGSAVAGLGWLEQVRALRSAADVNRLLHEASARERAIDAELEQLLARRGQLEQRLVELHAGTEEVGLVGGGTAPLSCAHGSPALTCMHMCMPFHLKPPMGGAHVHSCARQPRAAAQHGDTPPAPAQMLQVMKAEAEALAGSTADTAALAERVSRKVRAPGVGGLPGCLAALLLARSTKARSDCCAVIHHPDLPPPSPLPPQVRELDTAQSRVQATLSHISLVLDRMHAVEGIQSALAREDFEAAAECVARYLELEDELGAAPGSGEGAGAGAAAVAAAAAAATDADSRQAAEQAKVGGGLSRVGRGGT